MMAYLKKTLQGYTIKLIKIINSTFSSKTLQETFTK